MVWTSQTYTDGKGEERKEKETKARFRHRLTIHKSVENVFAVSFNEIVDVAKDTTENQLAPTRYERA